jgi:hypothetical protein
VPHPNKPNTIEETENFLSAFAEFEAADLPSTLLTGSNITEVASICRTGVVVSMPVGRFTRVYEWH